MRQLLSAVVVAGSIGACSLIYNPSNLPTAPIDAEIVPDAMIDAEVVADADPSMIAITSVSPGIVNEGQGDGGSHPAMIVVEGMQFVPGAKITLTKHSDQSPFAGAVVDDANTIVSDDGYEIAAPVKFTVDTTLPAGMMVRLDVTVTQKTASGMTVAKTLTAGPGATPVLVEKGLDEISDMKILLANNKLPSGVYNVSQVLIDTNTGGKSIIPNDLLGPFIIRAVASVKITGAVSVDAANQTAGPGGNSGGAGGMAGLSPTPGGPGGGSTGGGTPNGGGGSFGTKGGNGGGQAGGTSGERELLAVSVFQGLDSSSGGAGAGATTLAAGGIGGGGGGTIEISAGGDLTLNGAISSAGGNGTSAANGNGGGGSGGAILLRAGGALAVAGATVPGGIAGAGTNGTAGGAGGLGRIRVDAPVASALGFQGPQFVGAPIVGSTTLVARDPKPTLVVQGTSSSSFGYFFSNADGTMISNLMTATIANNGFAMFTLGAPLYHGLNHFCVTPAGGSTSSMPEALNCIDLVYLFKLP